MNLDWKAINKAVHEVVTKQNQIVLGTWLQSTQPELMPGDVCYSKLVDLGNFVLCRYLADMDIWEAKIVATQNELYIPTFEIVLLTRPKTIQE